MCFGWTWQHIDAHVTLVDYQAMQEYWALFPPVHEAFAQFVGVTPTQRPSAVGPAAGPVEPSAAEILARGEAVTEFGGDVLSSLVHADGVAIAVSVFH